MASTVRIGALTVNRLGFGAMRVCGTNIWGPSKNCPAAHAVLRKAYDRGLNFFDTADSYGSHVDEELIAEALHPYPKDLVIATRVACAATPLRLGSGWQARAPQARHRRQPQAPEA